MAKVAVAAPVRTAVEIRRRIKLTWEINVRMTVRLGRCHVAPVGLAEARLDLAQLVDEGEGDEKIGTRGGREPDAEKAQISTTLADTRHRETYVAKVLSFSRSARAVYLITALVASESPMKAAPATVARRRATM